MINISQVLIENEYLVNKLTDNYINKSLPHSLIIHGVKGIGKLTFTFFLIKNIYITSTMGAAYKIKLPKNI